MKHQALFSLQDKSKKNKMLSAAIFSSPVLPPASAAAASALALASAAVSALAKSLTLKFFM